MTKESIPNNQEKEIIWTALAERFNREIQTELDSIEATQDIYNTENVRYTKLSNLQDTVKEVFKQFDQRNYTIQRVEDDLKYRIDSEGKKSEPNEDTIEEYEQILLFIKHRGLNM